MGITFKEYLNELRKKSLELRIESLKMLDKAESGYTGSIFSAVEIMVGLYYGQTTAGPVMNIDPAVPGSQSQDYFILAKSQVAPLWYSILADLGYFDVNELKFFNSPGALLGAQPKPKIPGVAIGAGAGGQALAEAIGLALAIRAERQRNKVFVLMGDAETASGLVWEAALQAGHHKLGNLVVLVDRNTISQDGVIRNLNFTDPVGDKFEAMGFRVVNVQAGHDFNEILDAYEKAILETRLPVAIVFKTVKAKGLDFAEGKSFYHDKILSEQERQEALSVLEKKLQQFDTK